MKYIKADSVLPEDMIEELQNYIQGGYIYIPSKKEQRKQWGELSGYKLEIEERNCQIRIEYHQGVGIDQLADRYCLSIYTIKKIVYGR